MLTMTKIKNMQATPTETSVIKGLVSHGMTKDLSKEVYKFVKGLINSSPQKAGKATSAKAPQGPEYATKVDLLEVKMALKEDIFAVRAELKDEVSSVRSEISKLEASINKEIASSQNVTIKWIVSLFFAQIIAIISAFKYFVN